MTTDKKSGDYISKYALDYMRHKATACIGIRFLRYVTLTVTAGLYDRNGNYIAADGRQTPYRTYALLDARIAWERRHLRIYIDGNNITATRYCDFGGLKMPEGWFTGRTGSYLLITTSPYYKRERTELARSFPLFLPEPISTILNFEYFCSRKSTRVCPPRLCLHTNT